MEHIIDEFSLLEKRVEYINRKFVNEKIDKKIGEVTRLEIHHSFFENLGFRETKITNCDFSHNIFMNCYFKKSQLWNVDFTGSKFIGCNFDGAKIEHCDFIYSDFSNCFITYDNMVNNLSNEYNLREKLCRNLAIESLNAGYDKEYKKYFYEMKKAGEKDNFETFRLNPNHYYKQKKLQEKILAFIDFTFSKLNKFIWGYGENVRRLCLILVLIIILYALIFHSNLSILINNGQIVNVTFVQSIFISVMNFCTTSAGFYAGNSLTEVLFMTENILGVIFFGLFVSVLIKNINRR